MSNGNTSTILCAVPAGRGPANIAVAGRRQRSLVSYYITGQLPVVRSGTCRSLCFNSRVPGPLGAVSRANVIVALNDTSGSLTPKLHVN